MDLTFQVPMQYCSLQHRTLLLSPVTPTAGYCFCFGSLPSFFLELFLHWSPVAYWALPTWGGPLSVSSHFAFSYGSWGSQGKILKWFAIPFSSGPHSVLLFREFQMQNWVFLLVEHGCKLGKPPRSYGTRRGSQVPGPSLPVLPLNWDCAPKTLLLPHMKEQTCGIWSSVKMLFHRRLILKLPALINVLSN